MPRQRSLRSQSNHFCKLLGKPLALAVITIAFGCIGSHPIRAQEAAKKDSPAPASSPQPAEPTAEEKIAQLTKRVAQLTSEVERLRAELAKLEKYKQIDYTRDLMIKE